MDIKNKVVIITGGARGIGKSMAELFASEGAKVVICSRNEKELSEAAGEISEKYGECKGIKCDVSNSGDVKNFVKEVTDKYFNIDILINNAGLGYFKPLMETSEEDWDTTMDINLKGPFLMCKEVIPHIKKGIIVNISSGAGKHGFPNFSVYCASKFGLVGFGESIAGELPHIKVYTLCPGPVETSLFRNTLDTVKAISPEIAVFFENTVKDPQEISKIALNICKEENFNSGASIEIN